MSTTQSSPQPIDISCTQSEPRQISSPSSSQSPTSALSASLRAFSDLSLTNKPPVRLESDEFKQAYHHARRASFGNSASNSRPIIINNDEPRSIPTLSTSPGSNTSDLSSLPTPSSSPPSTSALVTPTSSVTPSTSTVTLKRSVSNGGSGINKTAAVPILGGVCEKEEIEALEKGELDHVEPASAPAVHHHHARSASNTEGSALFGGGARWGWPASGGSGTNSPPQDSIALRRGSLTFASPPGSSTLPLPLSNSNALSSSVSNTSSFPAAKNSPPLLPTSDPFTRMQPLGRVVSAGAALQTPQDGSGSSEGFSLFRRFSIGGFGSKKRPSPPSPPSLALPPRTSTLTAPETTPGHVGQDDARSRGRTLGASSTGAKPKRKLSPMGEKFLRGGY